MLSIPLPLELLRADFIIEVRGFLGVKDCPRHGGGQRAAQGFKKWPFCILYNLGPCETFLDDCQPLWNERNMKMGTIDYTSCL